MGWGKTITMILTESQRRGLNYVAVANTGGYQPTRAEVMEWLIQPLQKPGKRGDVVTAAVPSRLSQIISNIPTPAASVVAMMVGKPATYAPSGAAEPFVTHLVRLGWLRSDLGERLTVTVFGHALLKEPPPREADDDGGAETVILESGSPLSYARVVGHIGSSGSAFVIDPYLRVDDLYQLMTLTDTSRVLVGSNLGNGDVAAIRALLTATPGVVEVRQAGQGVLHDRYVIGDLGVHQFGTSMNGLGKGATTALFAYSNQACVAVRNLAEGWWSDASPLLPVL